MTFEILTFVFLIVIFTLELIFGSLILKVVSNLRKIINQMINLIREMCGDINDYNSILCTIHKEQIKQNEKTLKAKQVNNDHNFII